MKTSRNLGREGRENLEIHPLNGECRVGDLEVEFVTICLGDLPGPSCCLTSSADKGTGLSWIEFEECYSDKFLASFQP